MPVKKASTAKAFALAPDTSTNILSFYRDHARRCEAAARNAPNEELRAEQSKLALCGVNSLPSMSGRRAKEADSSFTSTRS
jgi:hypothetical protein